MTGKVKVFRANFNNYMGFRLARIEDSKTILNWRNSEHVRHFMNNTNVIPEENHNKWFPKALKSNYDLYFIYELNEKPVATLCFNRITNNSGEWGFYLGEKNLPKGTGTEMLKRGIDLAFNKITLETITANVVKTNEKSLYLHRKLGFVGKNTKLILKKIDYLNIV